MCISWQEVCVYTILINDILINTSGVYLGKYRWHNMDHKIFRQSLWLGSTFLIARFMGPTWGPPGATGPRWAPCWPHEPYYLVTTRSPEAVTYVIIDSLVLTYLIDLNSHSEKIVSGNKKKSWYIFISNLPADGFVPLRSVYIYIIYIWSGAWMVCRNRYTKYILWTLQHSE